MSVKRTESKLVQGVRQIKSGPEPVAQDVDKIKVSCAETMTSVQSVERDLDKPVKSDITHRLHPKRIWPD
ncbi:MAG: hypothetical protein M0Z78_07450 [Betaproteobacteria bacterium]|jgi:hypothetical protein|nr:hypothetical protein [Betaproteobacteria bacterium]